MAIGSWLMTQIRTHMLFDLPAGLGLLYFLNSCAMSMPMTAYMGFLNEELKLPQETLSLYFAVTFMPWNLKPLYGMLADKLPVCGYRYRPWLALSSACSAACYVFTGAAVTTIGGVFLASVLRAISNACAELMLGAVLVSTAAVKGGGANPTTLQAAASGCRFAGTLACTLVGLYLYPCGEDPRRLSDRAVIALTGCFPAAAAVCCFALPERHDPSLRVPCCRGSSAGGGSGHGTPGGATAALLHSPGARVALGFLLVMPLQAAVLWAQACSDTSCVLVPPSVWEHTLYALLATAVALPALALVAFRLATRVASEPMRQPLRDASSADSSSGSGSGSSGTGTMTSSSSSSSGGGGDGGGGCSVAIDTNKAVDAADRAVPIHTDDATEAGVVMKWAGDGTGNADADADGAAAMAEMAEASDRTSGASQTHPAASSTHTTTSSSATATATTTSAAAAAASAAAAVSAPSMPPLVAVAVLLALSVTPSAAIQSGSFRYGLFSSTGRLCQTQYLALIGYAANVISCMLFGRAFGRMRERAKASGRGTATRLVVVVGGLLGALGSLVELPLPLMCAHPPSPPPPPFPPAPAGPALVAPPAPPPCDMDAAFGVAAASASVAGIFSEIGFLPRLVIATEVAASLADRGLTDAGGGVGGGAGGGGGGGAFGGIGAAQCYAVMLMVVDMGDAISLQLTAPIVGSLGISYSDFSALPQLQLISVASSVAVLLVLALLWFAPCAAQRGAAAAAAGGGGAQHGGGRLAGGRRGDARRR